MPAPALAALIAKAKTALAGKPAWGKTLCVDFETDGVLFVYANNQVAQVPSANVSADCTLHLDGIATLNEMLSKQKTPTQEWWADKLTWDGDRSVAEQFVSILTGASA
jgi:ubiquinone biosynthesis protein UbiJ